jgi:hypothetical protein
MLEAVEEVIVSEMVQQAEGGELLIQVEEAALAQMLEVEVEVEVEVEEQVQMWVAAAAELVQTLEVVVV